MKLELWFAFVLAYTVISIIPGPSVFMVTGRALAHGVKSAFLCILGDIVGGFFLIALALFGIGAILKTSSELFQILKWAGVLYLAYLGYRQIRDSRCEDGSSPKNPGSEASLKSIRAGFLVGVLNPKAVLFYAAFLPQFLDPTGNPFTQFTILAFTSTVIVGTVLGCYALLAAQARQIFQSPKAQKQLGYTGGGFLLGGSMIMAALR